MLAGLHLPMLRLDHIFLPALNNGSVHKTGNEVRGECGRNYIGFPVRVRGGRWSELLALLQAVLAVMTVAR